MAKECFETCPEIKLAKAAAHFVKAFGVLDPNSLAACQRVQDVYESAIKMAEQCSGPQLLTERSLTPIERLLNFPPRVRCQKR